MKNNRFCLIVNPISGNFDNKEYSQKLADALVDAGAEVERIVLERKGQAMEISRQVAAQDNRPIVVAIGGDGTVNEVASSLVGTGTDMAIIPRGSGNGLGRTIQSTAKPKGALKYLLEGNKVSIDAGMAGAERFFCTCGFGFDAFIANSFNHGGSKKRGMQQYVKYIIRQFLTYEPVEASFSLDGKEYSGKYFCVTLSNANQYGNNAYIAPDAQLTDGKLWATMVRPFPMALASVFATALMGGYVDTLSFVDTVPFSRMEIHNVSSSYFHCDGESVSIEYPLTIALQASALDMLFPDTYKYKSPRLIDINRINQKLHSSNSLLNLILERKGLIVKAVDEERIQITEFVNKLRDRIKNELFDKK